jgi:hypothetical protein
MVIQMAVIKITMVVYNNNNYCQFNKNGTSFVHLYPYNPPINIDKLDIVSGNKIKQFLALGAS